MVSMNRGAFGPGDQVQLTDPKGRMHTITLESGKTFHTAKGGLQHDDLIGSPEGIVVSSSNGTPYLALRPLLQDFVLSMPRGATPIYPKDSSLIVGLADVHPGSVVVEAGAGSGALSCSLLRAIGDSGHLYSFERRDEFAEIAMRNVKKFFSGVPENWTLTVGDLSDELARVVEPGSVDRAVLDMLTPWECLRHVALAMRPGGVLCVYVATATQLSRTVETLRESGQWTEPRSQETLLRTWHVEGLAVRPDHRMVGHTGFLVFTRRLAEGTVLPTKRSRPAKGAYGPDYQGPRPAGGAEASRDASHQGTQD